MVVSFVRAKFQYFSFIPSYFLKSFQWLDKSTVKKANRLYNLYPRLSFMALVAIVSRVLGQF
jgi:hypothetical protein